MKVSYIRKLLRAGLGTTFFVDSELCNEPSSTIVQLQQPIQNRFPFSAMLWDNEHEIEDVDKGIIFDELFGDTSSILEPGAMGDKDLGAEQKLESNGNLSTPTMNNNEGITKAISFAHDNLSSVQRKADVDSHDTTQTKVIMSDVEKEKKKAKDDKVGTQKIVDRIGIEKTKVRRDQPEKSNRIPKVEVVKQDVIRVPSSNQLNSSSSIPQSGGINSPSQELNDNKQRQQLTESTSQEEKIQIPSDIAEQEKVHKSGALGESQMAKDTNQRRKSPEQIQPLPRKTRMAGPEKEDLQIFSDIAEQQKVNEPETPMKAIEVVQKPTGRQNLDTRFFTESSKKGKTQIIKITKDLALINKKLGEHISNEHSQPVKKVFLPKRPPSHNLGGWSDLDRNYIR